MSAATMRKMAISLVILSLGALAWAAEVQQRPGVPYPEISLQEGDRVLILAPHPDDEVLGCGGVIQHCAAKGIPLRVVFLTYGDSNEWSFILYRKRPVLRGKGIQAMGTVRHDEALEADRRLSVPAKELTFLGYPDAGTLHMWYEAWGDAPPFVNKLTEASKVPYKSALRPGTLYKGEELLDDLMTIMREFKPTKIFVSHAADHNADHLALYCFTKVALWRLEGEMKPEVFPYLIHYPRWPKPGGLHREAVISPPASLADQIGWRAVWLKPDEVARKEHALEAHKSQLESRPHYLRSFIRANELFGDFPAERVGQGGAPLNLVGGRQEEIQKPSEELLEEERQSFVGVESNTAWLEGEKLCLSVRLSGPLKEGVSASFHVMGYREDVAFWEMPKLRVEVRLGEYAVYDGRDRLKDAAVEVIRENRTLTLRVPLSLLGEPKRVLTAAHTTLGMVPLDWVPWRTLELERSGGSHAGK